LHHCPVAEQFRPSFSCLTDGLTFDSRILWDEFMVNSMTARCPGPVAANQATKNHQPSHQHDGQLVWCSWFSNCV